MAFSPSRGLRASVACALVACCVAARPAVGAQDGPSLEPPTPLPEVEEPIEYYYAPPANDLQAEVEALRERLESLEQAECERASAEQKEREAAADEVTVNWSGQLQSDFYWFNQDEANKASFGDIENGEAFRRARFGMFGDYGPAEYRIEMDFAQPGRPTFLDVWTGLKDLPYVGRVRVGHFFEPFSLERQTSNRFTTFMERSMIDQAFVPARNMGLAANNTWLEEYGTWAVGVYRSDSDDFGDDVGDDFETAFTGRVTYLPWYECDGSHYLHLGAAGSFRGANDDVFRFRSQPEARIGATTPNVPFFVDTGDIPADYSQLGGVEAAWIRGPFSIQSEYIATRVDALDGTSPFLHGWYAYVSYFLTGEHRPYDRENGAFDRVMPRRDFVRYARQSNGKCVCFGPGAWEIAFRVSQLDLNDEFVQGGRMTNLTAGLNWYLSPYLRMTTNYVHSFVDDAAGVESEADIFATRLGFEF